MPLSLNIGTSITGAYDASSGLISGTGAVNVLTAIALANGTAAGQVDGIFTATGTIASSQILTLGLVNGLIDVYGQDLEFSAIKLVYIAADAGNAANLVVGGGLWTGPFGAASNALSMRPGQIALLACQDATGWPVVAGSDTLLLQSSASASYTILIAGVSYNISAPVCLVRPTIIGTPQSGTPTALTAGQFSGSPTLTYQWKRGGTALPGATSATYTPISGDVGNSLSCAITATNAAGAIATTTAGVGVPS